MEFIEIKKNELNNEVEKNSNNVKSNGDIRIMIKPSHLIACLIAAGILGWNLGRKVGYGDGYRNGRNHSSY